MIDDFPEEQPKNVREFLKQRYPHQKEWEAYQRKNPLSARLSMSPLEDLRQCEYDSEGADGLPVHVISSQMRAIIRPKQWATFIKWIDCNPRYQELFIGTETQRIFLIVMFHRAYNSPLP